MNDCSPFIQPSLDLKLGLPHPPLIPRHAPRASTASTESTTSTLPTYSNERHHPPSYYTASSHSLSKLARNSYAAHSEADGSAGEPDPDMITSPRPESVQGDQEDDDADHDTISATLDLLSSQPQMAVDPLDRLMAQSQQILALSREILASCTDSRRQLDRYTCLESTMSESLFAGERQLRRSLSESEDREDELDKLARDVDAYATGSSCGTSRPGLGQLLAPQSDPRTFMTRSASSGHRSRSSVSQLQWATMAEQLPASTPTTAIDSLAAALSPTLASFANSPSPTARNVPAPRPARASDALAGMLASSSRSTPAPTPALPPTPPPTAPSAAVAALMKRTSSYATFGGSPASPTSPLSTDFSPTPQRRVTSPHLSPGPSYAKPSLSRSRSAMNFQSVAEEDDSAEQPGLVADMEGATSVKAGAIDNLSSSVASRGTAPSVRRSMMGHARKAPSISSLSILTGSAAGSADLSILDALPRKTYGALTRSEGYRSLSTPSPLANTSRAAPFQPGLATAAAAAASPAAEPIAIDTAEAAVPPGGADLASSVSSASHQRPSSLQQRHSSAGEDLMRVHAAGSSAGGGHRRKDSNLRDTLEGFRSGAGAGAGAAAEAKGKEEGGGWWGWR